MNIETKAVHAGELRPLGAVTTPIFQTAMYEYTGGSDYHDIRYIRLNNSPNHQALHAKLAALENAESALVAASGMAAISTTLLTLLQAGDHLLMQSVLYGGTHDLVTKDLPQLGISVDFIDATQPSTWKVKPNTKVIYVETISNPLMQVPDLAAVVAFAKANKLLSVIDNTFASPVLYRPIDHGFDLSLHSGTKYLNGHSDIVCGAVIGRAELVTRVKHKLDHLGGSLDPHACFLLQRGLKTLALRVRAQSANAAAVASMFHDHPAVARVNYPGLGNPLAAKALKEGFGGMLSIELKGGAGAAERFMERLQVPIKAPSLGSVESLVSMPAASSHSGISAEARVELGIHESLVRLSVGIENVADLLDDFRQALS